MHQLSFSDLLLSNVRFIEKEDRHRTDCYSILTVTILCRRGATSTIFRSCFINKADALLVDKRPLPPECERDLVVWHHEYISKLQPVANERRKYKCSYSGLVSLSCSCRTIFNKWKHLPRTVDKCHWNQS